MIFTSCTECGESIVCHYEAGEKPFGNVYEKIECEKCGANNYVQRISFGGVTLSEAAATAQGIEKVCDDCGGTGERLVSRAYQEGGHVVDEVTEKCDHKNNH